MDTPFIQLSQTQSHVSDSSSSTGGTESQSSAPSSVPSTSPSPSLSTHNTKKANYHVKDIAEFARTLEISANRAFPNRGLTRYKSVESLLLRWEEDELQVEWELNDLSKVFGDYKFNTETWLIPTESPLRKTMGKALQFVEDHESKDTLLIVYYGGHARINEARQSTWSCTRNLAYSSFEWNGCQALFEQSKSDTLLLLDCCSAAAAAAAVPCRTNSITEIIAACGWETWTPEPGRHSFTNALIEVLEDWVDRKSFSAAMLHSEILSVLKQPRPRKNREISKTPVYIVSTSNPKICSIELGRRSALTHAVGEANQAMDSASCPPCQLQLSPSTVMEAATSQCSLSHSNAENDDKFDLSSLIATLPDKTFVLPHVIMSIALETDQNLDLDGFEQWMRLFPALAKYAKIEGIYHSHSTLVLLSVPVVVWDMLPEDPAYNFVGYARSTNLLNPDAPPQVLHETANSYTQDDVSSHVSWDSSETVLAGNTAALKSALIAKYLTFEGEKVRSMSALPLKESFEQKAGLDNKGIHGNDDQNGPLGLSTLFDPSGPAIADLIFVHGLGGGSRKTWMKSNDFSSYWPEEWLPKDVGFQNVRIHSFGYDSNWNKESNLNINNFAEALLASIQDCPRMPRGSPTPLFFICHSMGGLVFKRAYVLAQQTEEFLPLASRIQSIVFLATPNRGSDLVQVLIKMLALSSGSRPPVADLHRNSLAMLSINDEFRGYCQNLRITSFYETLPSTFGLTKGLVVDKHRATLGYPNERTLYLNANHWGICKYDDVSDSNYLTIRNALASAVDDFRAREVRQRQDLEEVQQKRLDEVLGAKHALEDDFMDIDSLRMPGSCQWLIEKPSFREWQDSSGETQIYWISARPATGKTVLSGKVVTHLRSIGLDCSFYLFKHGNKSKSTISSFLLSMAWQMCRLNSDILSTVLDICENDNQVSKADYRIIWRRLFLDGIFQTRSQRPQYWVVDALDECTSEDDLVRMLSKLSIEWNLRIFLTSRNRIDSHRFPVSPKVKVITEEILVDDTKSDIRRYLDANMDQLPITDHHARQDLIATILGKSEGCFLWVSLVLQELSKVHTVSDVREVLEAVPSDMDVVYSRILSQMSRAPFGKVLTKAILTWTVCSARPLTTDELSQALKYHINDYIESIERSILIGCGQLVVIDSQSRVLMMHETARDFLLHPGTASEFAIDKREAHTRLFMTCMKYLNGEEARKLSARKLPHGIVSRKLSSFEEYACTMSFRHLVYVSSTDDQAMDALTKFLSSSHVLAWIEYAARHSDLNLLLDAGKTLKNYLQRRSKHHPLLGKEIALIDTWSNDLVRLVTKFGKYLLSSPVSIFTLIPPFCPPATALRKQFATSPRGIALLGPSATTWDDCLSTIVDPQDDFLALACSETRFAIGTARGKIEIHDMATCQQLRTLQHQEPTKVLKFGQERGFLASAGARFVCVWDLTSGKQVWEFSIPQQCLLLEFTDRDQLLLGALEDNCFMTWDMTTGIVSEMVDWTEDLEDKRAFAFRRPIFAKLCLELSLLVVLYKGKDMILWDFEQRSLHEACSRESEDVIRWDSRFVGAKVICVVFSSAINASLLAASYDDGDLVLFDISDCQVVGRTLANAKVLACSPDGRTLASCDSSGIIQIFDFETLKLLYRIHTEYSMDTEYSCIRQLEFSGDGHYLLDIRGSQCQVWEPTVLLRPSVYDENSDYISVSTVPLENKPKQFDGAMMITSVASHGNGKDIFCGKDNGSVYLYDAKLGQQTRRLFSHGKHMSVVKLYFDNKSETLVSVDFSSRIMIHRCTRLPKISEDLEPLFDQRAPTVIYQVLGNAGHTKLLMSLSTEDTLWTISSDGSSVTTTIKWEHRESFRWASHPSNPDQLVLIVGNILHLYEWSTLNRLTGPGGILLDISMSSTVNVTAIKPCFGQNFLATLFNEISTTQHNLRGFLWDTLDFAEDPKSTVQIQPRSFLRDQVQHLIGYFAQSLLYVDQDGWICSVGFQSTAATRHFFLPNDWLTTNTELIIEVTVNGDVVFAKRDELAVIKRGLEDLKTGNRHKLKGY